MLHFGVLLGRRVSRAEGVVTTERGRLVFLAHASKKATAGTGTGPAEGLGEEFWLLPGDVG